MPTLVLSPRYTDDSRTMRAAAIQAGWRVQRLGGWRAPDELRDQDVVLYGEPLFAEVVATRLGLALLDAPADWLLHLPAEHLRRDLQLSTMGDARARRGPVFVKPADGRKGFQGTVYSSGVGLPPAEARTDDTLVLVAEPVIWEVEFRCFVLDGEVVTLSPYLRHGELAQADDGSWPATDAELADARSYAGTVLNETALPPAVVLDVGLIEQRGWAVVEVNSCWGAGVYGCDPRRVLDVLARACVPRSGLTPADTPWALDPVNLDD